MKRVVVVGGAGDMAGVAVRWLCALRPDVEVVLADRNEGKARHRAASLGGSVSAEPVDVFDPVRLRQVLRGADLVVNASGPYVRTGGPVLEAAIDERIDYVDFGDDLEAADLMLGLDRAAREVEVTAVIGAGVAPGLVNVVARALADRLDHAESVQLAWVTGSTPPRAGAEPGGRAVIEHMIHSCIGVTVTVEDGRRRPIPAFRRSEVLGFPAPLGQCRVYDLGHAELATIPRFLPSVRRVRTQGCVHPVALNGVFQGLARAVAAGSVSWDDAVEFVLALERGSVSGRRSLAAALDGVLRQALRGELGLGGLAAAGRLARGNAEALGGLYVRVEGVVDGRAAGWLSCMAMRQTADGAGMDDVTGAPLAAIAHLMLEGTCRRPGVVAPEAVVDPTQFQLLLPRVGLGPLTALFDPQPCS